MKNILFSVIAALSVTAIAPAQAVERGGTLTFARYDDSTLIDPVYADRNPDIWMVSNLYDTLLRTEADGKTVVPGLASDYDLSKDGLKLTLTLRDDIRFSDGSEIEGKDVVFSLNRARNADLGPWSGLLGSVESVTASDNKITITLKNPDPTIVLMLATFNTAIVSKDAFDAAAGTTDQEKAQVLGTAPVGSGPFILKGHQRGASMNFVANKHYWRKGEDGQALPYLDGIDFIIVPDDATRIFEAPGRRS